MKRAIYCSASWKKSHMTPTLPDVPTPNWWVRQHPATKVILVIVTIGLVTMPLWLPPLLKKDPKPESEPNSQNPEPNQASPPADHTPQPAAPVETTYQTATLPNNGVGCSPVYQQFNPDYDFVLCNNVWHIITKPTCTDAKKKERYKNWTSLADNAALTAQLNQRYTK